MKRKTLAIPIRCVDYSNTSQVVTLFTREAGLLEGLAKGAHRERNPFQGPFDLAVLYEVVYIERQAAGLALLVEAAVLDGFRGLRRQWDRHVAAAHVIELLRAVATAGEGERELFDLTAGTLRGLEAAASAEVGSRLARFDLRALGVLGLFDPAAACVSCGRPWSGDDRPVYFSTRAGGLLCGRCLRGPGAPEGAYLRGESARALFRLARSGASHSPAPVASDDAVSPEVLRAVAALTTNRLERELVMLKSSAHWI